jgi:hypothetical protein
VKQSVHWTVKSVPGSYSNLTEVVTLYLEFKLFAFKKINHQILFPNLFADNKMKRENDDHLVDDTEQNDQPSDGLNSNMKDEESNTNNQMKCSNQDGPSNAKRLRQSDDEEIRLLIPSKVFFIQAVLFSFYH